MVREDCGIGRGGEFACAAGDAGDDGRIGHGLAAEAQEDFEWLRGHGARQDALVVASDQSGGWCGIGVGNEGTRIGEVGEEVAVGVGIFRIRAEVVFLDVDEAVAVRVFPHGGGGIGELGGFPGVGDGVVVGIRRIGNEPVGRVADIGVGSAELLIAVIPPCAQGPVLQHSEGLLGTGKQFTAGVQICHWNRRRAVHKSSIPKLAQPILPPGKCRAVLVQGHGETSFCNDLNDATHIRNPCGGTPEVCVAQAKLT